MWQQNNNKTHKDCTICGLVFLYFIWFVFILGGARCSTFCGSYLAPVWPFERFACQCGQTVVATVRPWVQLSRELSKIASEIAKHATGDGRNGARAATDKCAETAATTTSLVLGEVWHEEVID